MMAPPVALGGHGLADRLGALAASAAMVRIATAPGT